MGLSIEQKIQQIEYKASLEVKKKIYERNWKIDQKYKKKINEFNERIQILCDLEKFKVQKKIETSVANKTKNKIRMFQITSYWVSFYFLHIL